MVEKTRWTLSEQSFRTWDDSEIFYRSWLPEEPFDRALLLFHRGHEHSGRMQELVARLDLPGFACFAWDARGNGRSPGRRDWAENFMVYVRDADAFARHVTARHGVPVGEMAVVANSVGAVIATAWVHDFAPPIRAMVLATPAFRIKLYVPFAIPALRVALGLGLMTNVPSYVKANVLTHDPQQRRAIDDDALISHAISTNILIDAYDTSTRLIRDAGAIRVPTMVHAAGSDWVVKVGPQRAFFDGLSSPVKKWEFHPSFYHAIFHEQGRELPIASTREFILAAWDHPPLPSLCDADREGYTRREYDRLRAPSRNPVWAGMRFLMRTVGRLSASVQLGFQHGFDSGVMLDCVYRNQPEGITLLGRLIDYFHLESLGWRGIRIRRIHLERAIRSAIARVREAERPVRVVDIASGPGRYVLEAIRSMGGDDAEAVLRDYKSVNVEEGRRIAEDMGLKNVRFEIGDAFNRKELAELMPRPTIGIVSGLYELFPENGPVIASLSGLAAAIEPGGWLIYTNQPWHPQVEMIARVLPNREGKPWIMRRRTQEEMDGLVREAGFEKIRMEIDPWGIFTVSLARRIEARS